VAKKEKKIEKMNKKRKEKQESVQNPTLGPGSRWGKFLFVLSDLPLPLLYE
jgi:hypothetical protein